MCPSGINDFPMTNITHIKVLFFPKYILQNKVELYTECIFFYLHNQYVLPLQEGVTVLAKYKRPLLVHAEMQQEQEETDVGNDARSYNVYLKTRPPSW